MNSPLLPDWRKQPISAPPSDSLLEIIGKPIPTTPAVPEKSSLAKLQESVQLGERILNKKPFDKSAALQWFRRVRYVLAQIFGADCLICKQLADEGKEAVRSGVQPASMDQKLQGLKTLISHISAPASFPLARQTSLPSCPPITNTVFIIHGHDELNTRRLSQMLQDEFGLIPIVILAKPGMSRPLTDKFEDEAQTCTFAFALFTPDDEIVKVDDTYKQARPNVIYETGWFIGRLGKHRVALLLQHGTKIHSDLDGVSQIRFGQDIGEKFLEIRKELQAANVVT